MSIFLLYIHAFIHRISFTHTCCRLYNTVVLSLLKGNLKERRKNKPNERIVCSLANNIYLRLGYTFILMRQHHKTQYRISKRFHAFICCIFFGLFFVSSNQLSIYHCYHQRTRFRRINEFLYAIHIWANFYLFCFVLFFVFSFATVPFLYVYV